MDPIIQGLVFFAISEVEKAEKQRLEEGDDDARFVATAADAATKIIQRRGTKRPLTKKEKLSDL